MASGNVAGAHQPGPLGQETELYLVIAGDAGVGGAPAFILPLEVVDDKGAKFLLHVQHVVGHTENAAHGAGILHIVDGAATPVVIGQVGLVDVVKLHRNADDIVALPVQQQRSHRRIHAAAHGHDDAVAAG